MNSNDSHELALRVVHWATSKKAENVVQLDLRGILDVTDHFVLCTGFSEIQVQSIADAIVDGARTEGFDTLHVEGRDAGRWVLIDFVDVVAHVMLPEERDRYRLDSLWGDAAMTEFDELEQPTLVREASSAGARSVSGQSAGDEKR